MTRHLEMDSKQKQKIPAVALFVVLALSGCNGISPGAIWLSIR